MTTPLYIVYHGLRNMKTEKTHSRIFLVLVPHRDTRQILKKYSEDLLKAGLKRVYQFPLAVPLAELERPLTQDELKRYARSIRETLGSDKFTAMKAGADSFIIDNNELKLFGHYLGMGNGEWGVDTSNNKSIPYSPLPTPILGVFLHDNEKLLNLPLPPQLSFRASAVANMYIKPLYSKNGDFTGFKWKIGKLYWLPKETRLPKKV